jgi:hypothetical protein
MHVTKSAVARGASLVLLTLMPAARANAAAPSSKLPFDTEPDPPSYTFQLDVAMAMRSFPWLHFHMLGVGLYQPGESYTVHFTKIPWFAPRKQQDADLSMLDPLMWPRRYTYTQIGERDGNTLFALHAINDPTLESATVGIGPHGCARSLDATYNDGTHVQSAVTLSDVGGFLLPTTMDAKIDEPHIALTANADFKDYNFDPAQPQVSTSQ